MDTTTTISNLSSKDLQELSLMPDEYYQKIDIKNAPNNINFNDIDNFFKKILIPSLVIIVLIRVTKTKKIPLVRRSLLFVIIYNFLRLFLDKKIASVSAFILLQSLSTLNKNNFFEKLGFVSAASSKNENITNQSSTNISTAMSINDNEQINKQDLVNRTHNIDGSTVRSVSVSSFEKIDASVTKTNLSQRNIDESSTDLSQVVRNIDSSITKLTNSIDINLSVLEEIDITRKILNTEDAELDYKIKTGDVTTQQETEQDGSQTREGSDNTTKGDVASSGGDMGGAEGTIKEEETTQTDTQQESSMDVEGGNTEGGDQTADSSNTNTQKSDSTGFAGFVADNIASMKAGGSGGSAGVLLLLFVIIIGFIGFFVYKMFIGQQSNR